MKAKANIPADQYFRELEAWSRERSAARATKPEPGVVVDFLEAKRRKEGGRPGAA